MERKMTNAITEPVIPQWFANVKERYVQVSVTIALLTGDEKVQ
jgi:hypothetical protein